MKSPTRIHALLAALATGLLVVPAPSVASSLPNRTLRAIDNSVSLSFMQSQVGYGERLSGPSSPYFDTDQGGLPGGRIAVSGLRDDGIDNLYARVSFSQVSGHLGYNGGVCPTGGGACTPLMFPEYSKMTDWALRVGQGFVWGRDILFIPYVTYGKHDWWRGEPASVTNTGDYIEQYSNEYLGGGLLLQTAVTRNLAMTLNFAYAETLRPSINAPRLALSEGLGTSPWKRAGVSFDYRISRSDSFFVGARFTTFTYGAGPVVSTSSGFVGNEPYSKTNVVDYNVGFRLLY
ncbi:MAG: hypothetical protein ACYCRH_12940 [Acidiferrobacteraceae bacterium]